MIELPMVLLDGWTPVFYPTVLTDYFFTSCPSLDPLRNVSFVGGLFKNNFLSLAFLNVVMASIFKWICISKFYWSPEFLYFKDSFRARFFSSSTYSCSTNFLWIYLTCENWEPYSWFRIVFWVLYFNWSINFVSINEFRPVEDPNVSSIWIFG